MRRLRARETRNYKFSIKFTRVMLVFVRTLRLLYSSISASIVFVWVFWAGGEGSLFLPLESPLINQSQEGKWSADISPFKMGCLILILAVCSSTLWRQHVWQESSFHRRQTCVNSTMCSWSEWNMVCGDVNRERSGSQGGTDGQTSASGFNAAFRGLKKHLILASVAVNMIIILVQPTCLMGNWFGACCYSYLVKCWL